MSFLIKYPKTWETILRKKIKHLAREIEIPENINFSMNLQKQIKSLKQTSMIQT